MLYNYADKNKNILIQYQAMIDLENFLGDIEDDSCVFSFKQAIRRDELEEFPTAGCNELQRWGLHHFYVPCEFGGKLNSFETLFSLLKLIARRDLTIAIGHGKTFLGASPVFVSGSEEQKVMLSKIILTGGIISLGLTEKNHGADLVANEVSAKNEKEYYYIQGEKWLINNATRCNVITILAKTDNNNSSRSHSVFLIDKASLHNHSYDCLPKLKTHGIRGADISGIKFNNLKLNKDKMISHEGSGLEVILKSLQISRMMCASLSLGAADTALRVTLDFILNRNLYNLNCMNIPYVNEVIINSYIDILTCDAISLSIVRCLHNCPQLMSLYSSIVKYFVPTTIEKVFDSLAATLGARFYLREEHKEGIFQKFMRDNSIVGLFDGSTMVNLQVIANQINQIAKNAFKNTNDLTFENTLSSIFTLNIPTDKFDANKLKISNHGKEIFGHSFEKIIEKLNKNKISISVNDSLIIINLLSVKKIVF
jgi:alkylation response protein AidB-like acyl-CoA dehydrogenase